MANIENASFTPQGLTYARTIGTSQTNASLPVGFTKGGTALLVYNSGPGVVFLQGYQNSLGVPTMAVPADGAPPVGQPGCCIPPNAYVIFRIPLNSDSLAGISTAAATTIYFQRGKGI